MKQKVAVTSAKHAVEIAESILKQYAFKHPLKAQRTGDMSHVQIDVGVFKTVIADFRIDATSGDILEYAVIGEEYPRRRKADPEIPRTRRALLRKRLGSY